MSSPSVNETLGVFARLDPPGTPLTAAEVADALDCPPADARRTLGELVERGRLETKRHRAGPQLWWRANGHEERSSESPATLERAQFRELVDEVTNYAIFVLDEDGYVRTWNSGAERIKGYTEEEIIGKHFSIFYTEEDRRANRPGRNLEQAAERGRIEDEGWRRRKDDTEFWANVVITALYDDDGEVRGFAKVTRDMTDRHEYEQTIERERERLEFVNRLIRHNLLNGLHVVNARGQVLASRLPADNELQTHVETIRTRSEDMSSLIERMRQFMDVVVAGADHETEPIDLRSHVEEKVQLARETYPDAEFETHDLPPPSTRVLGDSLAPEAIENVLANAVQHNDAATPRVEIWTTETTQAVPVDGETGDPLPDGVAASRSDVERRQWPALALHVKDNGPGIPKQRREAVLEKGVSELQNPANGFGLYLVREMMDAYGGTVLIQDPAPPAREHGSEPGERRRGSEPTEETTEMTAEDTTRGTVFTLVFLEVEPEAETGDDTDSDGEVDAGGRDEAGGEEDHGGGDRTTSGGG